MDVHGITDDLLKLILLRIDSPIYLLRAASTCKRLYRIVAGSGFLHSYRSIHGPLAAYAYFNGNHEVSRPDFDSSYFCLDFLPDINICSVGWPVDRRGGLVLFGRVPHKPRMYQVWVVCEPFSLRHEIIPPILPSTDGCSYTWAFLLDGNEDGIGILNFKVLCAFWTYKGYRPYMFTSGGSWSEICIGSPIRTTHLSLLGFAEGSVFWHVEDKMLLAVNRRTTKLECFQFPHVKNLDYCATMNKVTVTAGSDGEARIVVGSDDGNMMVFVRQRGSSEWVLEKRIHISAETHGLPPYHDWFFHCAMPVSVHRGGTVIIRVLPNSSAREWRIDLDRETVELLDRVPRIRYPCELPWPPVVRDY